MQLQRPTTRNQSGFGHLVLILVVVVVSVIAAIGFFIYHRNNAKDAATTQTQTTTQSQSTVSQTTKPDPYAGWSTYTSATEKASFRYPADWTVTKPSASSTNADQAGVKSPSGSITISWVSDLGKFNNCRCDYGPGTPNQTIIDKTEISGAKGYWVVAGLTTLDEKVYHPWLAVQDSEGQLISSRVQNTVAFRGRHNLNTTTKEGTFILFSTSGTKTDQDTPALTKDQASSWFLSQDAQAAKYILLSFNDPQPPAYTIDIKEWGITAKASTNFSLSYKMSSQNGSFAKFDSSQLAVAAKGCSDGGGGSIGRLKPNDYVYGPPVADYTAEQFATDPKYKDSRANIVKVGDYYYFYYHNQGPCADVGDLQEYTQDAVRDLLQSFQPE